MRNKWLVIGPGLVLACGLTVGGVIAGIRANDAAKAEAAQAAEREKAAAEQARLNRHAAAQAEAVETERKAAAEKALAANKEKQRQDALDAAEKEKAEEFARRRALFTSMETMWFDRAEHLVKNSFVQVYGYQSGAAAFLLNNLDMLNGIPVVVCILDYADELGAGQIIGLQKLTESAVIRKAKLAFVLMPGDDRSYIVSGHGRQQLDHTPPDQWSDFLKIIVRNNPDVFPAFTKR